MYLDIFSILNYIVRRAYVFDFFNEGHNNYVKDATMGPVS